MEDEAELAAAEEVVEEVVAADEAELVAAEEVVVDAAEWAAEGMGEVVTAAEASVAVTSAVACPLADPCCWKVAWASADPCC